MSYINSTSSSRASWLFPMITCTIDVILSEIAKVLSTLGRKKEAAPGDSADPGARDMQRHRDPSR